MFNYSTEHYLAFLYSLSIWVLPGLFAITIHEAAHGLAALYYGDKTAFFMGRTSLNPIKHIDPVGTVIVPLFLLYMQSFFLFGWAKPVPVNQRNLRNPRKDMAMIALAGPLSNLVMFALWLGVAKITTLFYSQYPKAQLEWLLQTSNIGILFNLILAVFNLLPIPPLDGSKIISAICPPRISNLLVDLEPYGLLIIVGLIFTGILPMLISTPIMLIYRFSISLLH